jgi:hypothetical protein
MWIKSGTLGFPAECTYPHFLFPKWNLSRQFWKQNHGWAGIRQLDVGDWTGITQFSFPLKWR